MPQSLENHSGNLPSGLTAALRTEAACMQGCRDLARRSSPAPAPGVKMLVGKRPKSGYDFLDLGCKIGGSIGWAQRKYGGRGLGVDFNLELVREAIENGYDAIHADALKLDFPPNSFRFISMMDFLEHLPSEVEVKQTLANCKRWARDFFFIHHPSFEDVDYLKTHNLKLDWTDWHGHPSGLTIRDFELLFNELGLDNFTIERTRLIVNSMDDHIVPLDAPTDTVGYDEGLGPKKNIEFDRPIYGRVEVVVQLR
jgi:hypothetical protein